MNRALFFALLGALLAAAAALGQIPPASSPITLVDRVVAVVDEDPILLSDLERVVGLGLAGRVAGESESSRRRRALDGLIEDRLRYHEIQRSGFEEAPLTEVETQLERVRSRFADEASWQDELRRLGLSEAEVRSLLAHQLAVLRFVEQRLGPRVFVGVEEIRKRYDEVLVPELRGRGEEAPPIEEVREALRAVLREERLNAEIDRWTKDLRRAADVVDLLEAEARPLPPPVAVFDAPPL